MEGKARPSLNEKLSNNTVGGTFTVEGQKLAYTENVGTTVLFCISAISFLAFVELSSVYTTYTQTPAIPKLTDAETDIGAGV